MSATVPEGLSELLEEFAVAVLREKPADLLQFAARYFQELQESRRRQLLGGDEAMAAHAEPASTAEIDMDAEEGEAESRRVEGEQLPPPPTLANSPAPPRLLFPECKALHAHSPFPV